MAPEARSQSHNPPSVFCMARSRALARRPDRALGLIPGRNDAADDVEHLLRRSGRRIAGGGQTATGNAVRNKLSQCASELLVGRGGIGFWAGHFGKEIGGVCLERKHTKKSACRLESDDYNGMPPPSLSPGEPRPDHFRPSTSCISKSPALRPAMKRAARRLPEAYGIRLLLLWGDLDPLADAGKQHRVIGRRCRHHGSWRNRWSARRARRSRLRGRR